MKTTRTVLLLSALVIGGCSDADQSPVAPVAESSVNGLMVLHVTSSADVGPGSFRDAVAQANANASIGKILLRPRLRPIELMSTVVYTGAQDLVLAGQGATLDGSGLSAGATTFLANGGGDLVITGITFRDAPGHGMIVQVPADAEGTQRVALRDVAALGNLGHGVEINDQQDPDDAGDPDNGIRGNAAGSNASLVVDVVDSNFDGNGFGTVDRDGLRVNEGGLGDLTFSITGSTAVDNGADGVELDERGEGSLSFRILRSHFSRNGDYDQSADPDKDDGFDADEADAGDFLASVLLSTANDNFEEGFDFNENDAGDMRVTMKLSEASGNPEEGIDLEEDDDWQGGGDLVADLDQVTANGNTTADGHGGIKIRERGDGNLEAVVRGSEASGNTAAGIHMREQAAGSLEATVTGATAGDNGLEGIFLREDDAGDQQATVRESSADGNGADGINFDEK